MQLVENWRTPEDEYSKGNRAWLPCTDAFYWEMLEVMPPIHFYPALGLFGVIEAWKCGPDGNPLHLFFVKTRDGKAAMCRIASRKEIRAEFKQYTDPIDEENRRKDAEWRARYAR